MKKKRRILLVGPLPPPIGGDTVSTYNLLHSRYWKEEGCLLRAVNVTGENRLKLPEDRLTGEHWGRGLRIFLRVARRLPGSDIVLLWANARFIYTAGLPIILLSRLLRRPVIVKPFGTYLVQRFPEMSRPFKAFLRAVLSRCERVLPQTLALKEAFLGEIRLPESKVTWFPNFLTDESFAVLRQRKTFTGRCVFIGQIKREKGIFDIIEGLRNRPELSCDFFGPIIKRDEPSFFRALSGADNCSYRGVLKPQEVINIMAGYDVFLFPTYHPGEGYPAAILQAFAVGVPVVASAWTSVPDLVEDGVRGLLVPVKSPSSIAAAVSRLGSDPVLYGSIVERAGAYVQAFSEKAVVRDLLIGDILARF
ncbi:MAG: glycosyltransferase family 4 protein [Candidatus Krumholzibacteriota bacterium]|nr:glycosyltransferase family 4 protein [Candidatus Krumholzibacteriota bacterium]